jgi:glutamate synthase (NADPH/NADH) small chain
VAAFNDGAISRDTVPLREGERIAVIGGGNVAMDTARTAIRLGGDVTVLYRRTEADMPCNRNEYEEAVKEGVKFAWQTEVTAFVGNGKKRLAAVTLKTPEGERTDPFDRVFLAIAADRPTAS